MTDNSTPKDVCLQLVYVCGTSDGLFTKCHVNVGGTSDGRLFTKCPVSVGGTNSGLSTKCPVSVGGTISGLFTKCTVSVGGTISGLFTKCPVSVDGTSVGGGGAKNFLEGLGEKLVGCSQKVL